MSEFIIPTIRRTVNEGGGLIVTTRHRDENGDPAAPTNLWYRIDDLTNNNRVILDWTVVPTPGTSNTITVTGSQNDLEDADEEYEVRQLTTYALDASGTPNAQDFHYQVDRIFKETIEYPTA